jgi:hypothetical protein
LPFKIAFLLRGYWIMQFGIITVKNCREKDGKCHMNRKEKGSKNVKYLQKGGGGMCEEEKCVMSKYVELLDEIIIKALK